MAEVDRDELAMAVLQARAAWPAIDLPDARFRAYLTARLPDAPDALARVHIGYLYLCCACLDGAAEALAAFDAHFLQPLRAILIRTGADDDAASEVLQALRTQLLAGTEPGIASYSGRGDLRGWLRVTAVRELLRRQKRDQRMIPADDAYLAQAAATASDPELDYLKRACGHEFTRALADAVRALPDRQRALLRLQVVERLSIDEVGTLYQAHRSTAARWLAEARAALAGETRRILGERLQIGTSEIESILRAIDSQIDVSIGRFLDPVP